MTEISFGIFDHIDKQSQPLSATYADRLRLLEVADAAGFYSFHLAEHHATPLCMAAAPSLFLAALTQRTRQLRLGPLVFLLPVYHPLRLIEEVCMLDQLSGGRLDIGVGRGISPIELRYMDVDPNESRDRFREELEILLLGLRSTRLNYQGRFHRLNNVPIEFSPVQKPHPPIWYPTSAGDRVPWIGEQGFSTVLPDGGERLKVAVDRYWEAWHRNHAGDDRQPRIGTIRTLFIANSEREALDIARPNFRQHYNSLVKLWNEHNLPTATATFTPDLDQEIADDKAYIGTASQVRDQIAQLVDRTGIEYVVLRPLFGDMPIDRALYSFGMFVNEVMPAFQRAAVATA